MLLTLWSERACQLSLQDRTQRLPRKRLLALQDGVQQLMPVGAAAQHREMTCISQGVGRHPKHSSTAKVLAHIEVTVKRMQSKIWLLAPNPTWAAHGPPVQLIAKGYH